MSLQTVGKTGTQGSHAVSNDNDTECTKSDAEHILGDAGHILGNAEHILGDAEHILGDAETTFTNVLTISIGS